MKPNAEWLVRLPDGEILGPFSENQIRHGLDQDKIVNSMRIRQGNSGWIPVARVRLLFEQLSDRGIYVRDSQQRIHGPFTLHRYQQLQNNQSLPFRYWMRQGDHGEWKCVEVIMDEVASEAQSSTPSPQEQSLIDTIVMSPDEALSSDDRVPQLPPAIPAAPVLKLQSDSWSRKLAGIRELVETALFGDPLANSHPSRHGMTRTSMTAEA